MPPLWLGAPHHLITTHCSPQICRLIMIAIATPIFLVALPFIMLTYFRVFSYYRANARELKRLEAISFSPIQNKFGETVDGLASIRAFGLQVRAP